jgi:(2Fe-2S) ferredoxin
MDKKPYRVHLCFGPTCSQFNPKALLRALEEEIATQGLEEQVSITISACRNRCEQSPSMNVYPGPVMYNRLTPDAVRQIVRQHFTGGDPVEEWLYRHGLPPVTPPRAPAGRVQPSADEADKPKWRWW